MRELFNEEQKKEFFESLPNYSNKRIKRNYENLFYITSKYEFMLQKDFCNMNIPEVKMVVVSIGFLSAASLYTTISMMRDYNNWCVANGKTNNENSLLKLQSSDFDLSFAIQSKLLKSPEQLIEILEKAYNNDEIAYQKQSKLIALLLYFSFNVDEIRHLTVADIEIYRNSAVNFSDNSEQFEMIINLMQECSKLYEIRSNNGRGGAEKINYLIESEYILRSKTNVKSHPKGILSYSVILDRIRDINMQYSQNTGTLIELSVDRISRSGKFYRIYQQEQQGQEISMELICQIFGMTYKNIITVRNEVSKKIKDYKNWKKAFGL